MKRVQILLTALLASCSAPCGGSSAVDAGSDGGWNLSCGGYVNAIGVPAFRCEWQVWQCETPAPAPEALDLCRQQVALLGADASCDMVQEVVEGCR